MKSKIDKVLHTSGYLPPRNEKEMIEFEKVYSKVKVNPDFHIDTKAITSGPNWVSYERDRLLTRFL